MAKHIVLEIDEEIIGLTLADVRRTTVRILASRTLRIPSHESSALVFGIHDVLKDIDKGEVPVHVALSDPGFLHFDVETPHLPPRELEATLEREARRQGSVLEGERLRAGYRKLEKVRHGVRRYGVVAIVDKALQPVLGTLRREGFAVGMVTSVEEAAIRSLPKELTHSAVFLDYDDGRVRFIYLERGVITLRRQIELQDLAASEDGKSPFELDRVATEMRWNLDYLRGAGRTVPTSLVLGIHIPLSREEGHRLAGELTLHPPLTVPFKLPENTTMPGQPTIGLLQSLQRRESFTVLSDGRRKEASLSHLAATLCLAATAASLASSGWIWIRKEITGQELQLVEGDVSELKEREEKLEAEQRRRQAGNRNLRIRTILSTRRPMSLLLSRICAIVPEGIEIRELQLMAETGVTIVGEARRTDTTSPLQNVRNLRMLAQSIPFLEDVRERIDEYESESDSLCFRIAARWRLETR